jgi:hypothetical protein
LNGKEFSAESYVPENPLEDHPVLEELPTEDFITRIRMEDLFHEDYQVGNDIDPHRNGIFYWNCGRDRNGNDMIKNEGFRLYW